MEEKLKVIERNKTWELRHMSTNKTLIDVKWIYETKMTPNGESDKYK